MKNQIQIGRGKWTPDPAFITVVTKIFRLEDACDNRKSPLAPFLKGALGFSVGGGVKFQAPEVKQYDGSEPLFIAEPAG